MRQLQKQVLSDALDLLSQNTRPGEIVTVEYPNTASNTSRRT